MSTTKKPKRPAHRPKLPDELVKVNTPLRLSKFVKDYLDSIEDTPNGQLIEKAIVHYYNLTKPKGYRDL
ncbi:hypothetical protein J7384_17150 [Endozoicomonas sp. G2_1]|uniref:hypothetical protein n=1 Tax=Endozoicomonas sp. G2_1 TaxID=2821091 RepID=UPI001ADB499F|nr:hypothetical protein [Endozoicomonas sp. G2_1]MBO9492092.1 hypothetical protein [Endozoicomonas sp. G2_1]